MDGVIRPKAPARARTITAQARTIDVFACLETERVDKAT
jgi:hypothetical protein